MNEEITLLKGAQQNWTQEKDELALQISQLGILSLNTIVVRLHQYCYHSIEYIFVCELTLLGSKWEEEKEALMAQLFALTEQKETLTNEKSQLSDQLKSQLAENENIISQLNDSILISNSFTYSTSNSFHTFLLLFLSYTLFIHFFNLISDWSEGTP